MEQKDKVAKEIGYKLGRIFGTICVACVASLVVALTIKLIIMMF